MHLYTEQWLRGFFNTKEATMEYIQKKKKKEKPGDTRETVHSQQLLLQQFTHEIFWWVNIQELN